MLQSRWCTTIYSPLALSLCLLLALASSSRVMPVYATTITTPVLFVTQVPIPDDFTTIGAVFGNHRADMQSVGRGGDLWIRYADGTLKNLTQAAGFGSTNANGFQGANAIAVRDPAVHWNGNKALFSMVVGAPARQYDYSEFHWQIYEIRGLGKDATPVISKVPNQPKKYNNITPIYGTDDRIIFTSDRPHSGATHLYPQRDEYEEAPTVAGLYSLDPNTGELILLTHTPSGAFSPGLDSFGRVIFIRWDHLQRDQQADADREQEAGFSSSNCAAYCTFNYTDESANATPLPTRHEVFPEPRAEDQLVGTNLWGHTFNVFAPWQIHEDGTAEEILNHLGRHELVGYIPPSFTDDPNLVEYYGQYPRYNPREISNFLQIKEDPTLPGRYFGTDAPEFSTHASGQIVSLNAAPTINADRVKIHYWTHRDTASYTNDPSAHHSGLYRDPLPLSSGAVVVVHTTETRQDNNDGSRAVPQSRYDFRLKTLSQLPNEYWVADTPLTNGITKKVWYWDPDFKVTYDGPLWELQPVEVRPRPRPVHQPSPVASQEQQAIANAGVDVTVLQQYLVQHNLALLVSRNVTTRDDQDRQQPFNLRVAGSQTQTLGANGKVYPVKYLQLFQADLIRGLGGLQEPRQGRRVLAQHLHDAAAAAVNPQTDDGPLSSVVIAPDGSTAAFVPARRAVTWQLTDANGTGVVRERYWITFQPGEIRMCTSCHGANKKDQAGNPPSTNVPEALTQLLEHWKSQGHGDCTGKPAAPILTVPAAGAEVSTRRVALDWHDALCASEYRVFVRQDSPQGPQVDGQQGSNTSQYTTHSLTRGTKYYWRANACNAAGCSGSAWQPFTISTNN